ncbi:hypothetical protein [Ahrensia sp. R2A130]|uniref:N-acyl amino acid synthase FeeM domain-containing protein n=1 Tax=Ahrensia sp. R2A130 TaxID=744979 RepID=UPI0001E0F11A|nr:hypothetical protein [Ahrensia sp. R2A130]EFL88063.1 conserved hypothetical protein [Ahrensia sp. R2A130]
MKDIEDRNAVLELRKRAYGRHNGDTNAFVENFMDSPDEQNAVTIGLFLDRVLVGACKVSIINSAYPQSQWGEFFPNEMKRLLSSGKTLIDPARLVADLEVADRCPELPFLMMRIPVAACQHFPADECLSIVRRSHAPFYRRMFRAKPLAPPKLYEPLDVELVIATCTIREVWDEVLTRNPFWRVHPIELREMFGPVSDMPAFADFDKTVPNVSLIENAAPKLAMNDRPLSQKSA